MIKVVIYSRRDCSLCQKAIEELNSLIAEIPHKIQIVDIDIDPELQRKYMERIPVVEVGPYTLNAPFDRKTLRMTLGAARDTALQLDMPLPGKERNHVKKKRKTPKKTNLQMTDGDRVTLWLSRHYLAVLNFLLFIYVGMPFFAPVLMRVGYSSAAKPIYAVYSVLCHQLSYRSWFLFGEQPFYPREAAHVEGYLTYEQAININAGNTNQEIYDARSFLGNEVVGYKVAYCQRDVAIYGAMLVFGLLYAVTGRRIPPLAWYVWFVVGLGPIGLDGGSQLLSQFLDVPIMSFRESTPFLRTFTGSLFGFTTAWFGFPLIQETMDDARKIVLNKLGQIKASNWK
jgi:uncharacterized membrane protein